MHAASSARALRGFFFDWLVGLLIMAVLLIGGMMVWAIVRGFRLAMAQAGQPVDAAALTQAIGTPGPLALLLVSLLAMGGMAVLMYFWRRRANAAERAASWQAARRPGTWKLSACVALAVFAFSTVAMKLGETLGLQGDPSNLAMIRQVLVSAPLFCGVFVVVLAPCYEELFFRRVLFGRLATAGRPALGIVLSSLAFALAHEVPGMGGNPLPTTLFLLCVYATMGAAFAWLYWRTRTLWASILAHALNNALALALMLGVNGS